MLKCILISNILVNALKMFVDIKYYSQCVKKCILSTYTLISTLKRLLNKKILPIINHNEFIISMHRSTCKK